MNDSNPDNQTHQNTSPGRSRAISILDHPIHPILIPFPLALLSAALLSDLRYWQTGDAFWADFSFWLVLGGWLSSGAAAFIGLIDFLRIEAARKKRSGWFHFILNDLAVFLTTFNLIIRLTDRQGSILFSGLVYSAVVTVILLIAAVYGVRLVYRYQISVVGNKREAGEE